MNVLEVYKEAGGYLEGHFLLASGRHSPKFLQSTTVLQHPDKAERMGAALAAKFESSPDFVPDFVVGPAMGGVVLAFVVARALACRALFAEKDGSGGMMIREAFSIKPGETFVAVEDVVTTAGSLQKAIRAVESHGATLVGTACIIDRRPDEARAAFPILSLTRLVFPTYSPDACPLCDAGTPLEQV
ncbi:orotate phosphoribosyltransferase [soil metagenome]